MKKVSSLLPQGSDIGTCAGSLQVITTHFLTVLLCYLDTILLSFFMDLCHFLEAWQSIP
jgi:hypothetical protein